MTDDGYDVDTANRLHLEGHYERLWLLVDRLGLDVPMWFGEHGHDGLADIIELDVIADLALLDTPEWQVLFDW